MRFSFIIPTYNAERTIERCIESIMSDVEQYGNECEILVVDNESTDNSNQLILEFTKKYPYISLHECSKGVSRARNTGIKAAKGEKIIFVDSDDLWVPGSLEAIDKILIANDTQLIQFAYYKNDSLIKHNIETDKVVTQNYYDKYRAWMIAEPTVRMQVWAKAFDRQVMLKNNIYFNEDLSYSEDGDFVFRYMQNAKNMIVVNLPIYRYCQDYGSTMRQHSNSKILVGGGYQASLESTKRFVDNEPNLIKKAFDKYTLVHLNIVLVHDIFDACQSVVFKDRMRQLSAVLNIGIYKDALSSIAIDDCLTKNMLPELLMKFGLKNMCGVLCLVKSRMNYKKYGS